MGYLDCKYAPVTLEDMVFAHAKVTRQIEKIIQKGFGAPIIIHGHFGVGKLSVANYVATLIKSNVAQGEVLVIKDDVGLSINDWLYSYNSLLTNKIKRSYESLGWSEAKKRSISNHTALEYLPSYGETLKPIAQSKQHYLILIIHRGNFLTTKQIHELNNTPSHVSKWKIPRSRILIIVTTTNLASLPLPLVNISNTLHLPTPKAQKWLKRLKYIIKSEGFNVPADKPLLNLIKNCKGNGRHMMYALESAMWD